MVTNVLISGVEYRALNDYQIKQQAGAVGTLSITVDRVCTDGTVRPIPISQQSAIIKIDGATVASGIIQKVTGGQYETGYEPMLFKLDIQSFEAVLNRRLVKHNFYSTTTPTISDIVLWIYNNILAEEGFSLGKISATSEYIRSYKKNYEKVSDVLDDLAGRIDGCSWYITPEKAFYFLIADDFPTVTTPTHITNIEYSEASGDLRTVQTVVGASSRITGTEDNPELIASIAILSGTSGKIEVSESDSTIHNDNDALSSAQKKIEQYGERERTVTLTCNDLTASALYNTWTFEPGLNNKLPAEIEGDFVVTDRTISVQGDRLDINVTLKNRNYFCRYGYTYKKFQRSGKDIGDAISDIYSDNKLTPVEKITTRQRWEQAVVEKSTLDEKANFYGVSPADYDAAFQSVADYLNGGIKWVYGYPAWITDDALSETTDYDLEEYSSKWNDYEAGKSECLSSISNAQLAVLQNNLDAVRNGDLVDGAIDRAKLEADFRDEHDSVLAQVYPFGPTAEPAFASLERRVFEVGNLTDVLERNMLDRDEGMVLVDQRILLIAEDINTSLTRISSLEVAVGSITATVSEYEGDHARIGELEIQADDIELSVADYDTEKAKIAQLQLDVESINSILSELEIGGEIINLSLITQNADRIAGIVADGGYTVDGIFYPTKAYTQVGILKNRFDLFVAGDPSSGDVTGATWIVTPDQIEGFVVAADVSALIDNEVGPIDTRLSQVEQDADSIVLTVQALSGTVTRGDVDTADELLKMLGDLQLQSESGIIITQNKIDISVQEQETENTLIWSRITLEAERITAEVARAIDGETTLGSRITIEADRINSEVSRAIYAEEELEYYAESQASSAQAAAQSYADAVAELAETTAKAYADGIVTAEEQRAIADAQAKANAARDAAIAAAAADATNKADGAKIQAIAYTSSQVSQLSDQISHRVLARAYDATTDTWSDTEAFMALKVALPEVISSERRAAIGALLSAAELIIFDRVYESFVAPWHEGLETFEETRYRIASNPAPADIDSLTQIFTLKGLLSSQFLVDADEVFMNGTIRGRHLEMDSISTEVFTAVRAKIAEGVITKLQASEINTDSIKAISGFFENISVTGTINNVSADQLQPTFTHRMKWESAGTYYWTIPAYVKWMRFTVRGAGGGGAGGMYLDACGTAGGNGGWTGISGAIHGVYLNAESGYGAPGVRPFSAPGGAGGVSSNRDTSSDFIGGRNGGAGSSATNVGGQGGIPGGIIGLYNDIIERTNIAQSIDSIWLGVAATCPEHSNGYNGYPGNGGAGGCSENVKAGTTSGGGGGAGAIRQVTSKIDEIAGQALTITIGAGGAGGIGASGAHNGGRGGDGQIMIEW